jgi:hypothetical protein
VGRVDGDDGHSPPAVHRPCPGASWWLGAGADDRRWQVVAWSAGATSCPRVLWRWSTHALAGASVTGHVWACRVLASPVHRWVQSRVQAAQESVGELEDMLVHVGEGQRSRGHGELMPWSAWMQWVKLGHLQWLAGDGEGEVR